MRLILLIIGLMLIIIALVCGISLKFANPDMTDLRLWMEYPVQQISLIAMMLMGFVLIALGVRKS
jgi:uncharacterized membrane protein